MLTVQEVADRLGLNKHQVYRRINRKDIPAVQSREPNLRYMIPEQGLQDYIDGGGADKLTPVNGTGHMLRAPEVAAMTGFTVETVRRMCYEGTLPYHRGAGERGHLRIPRVAVEEYLNRK